VRLEAYIIHTEIHGVFAQEFMALFFMMVRPVTLQRVEGAGPERKSLTSPVLYWVGQQRTGRIYVCVGGWTGRTGHFLGSVNGIIWLGNDFSFNCIAYKIRKRRSVSQTRI
jgi:hypothetical protein